MRTEQQSESIRTSGAKIKKNDQWELEDHVCRKCFGRLLSRPLPGGDMRLYLCTNCGAESQHTDTKEICCCGIKIRKAGRNGTKNGPMVDAGVRCIPNPEISPSFPSLFVASEVAKK